MNTATLVELVDRYTTDPESVYTTWFVSGGARMKAFRAIRRGVRDTVDSIAAGTFGMVNGFNALFADKKKLGSWDSYLAMREIIVRANNDVRNRLSKDLGAFAGLLYEIGVGRLVIIGDDHTILHKIARGAPALA